VYFNQKLFNVLLKKFFSLSLLSLVLTFLFGIVVFLALYTLPVLYEKYEDQVDDVAAKAMVQVNKQYAVLDAKVLQKIPRGPFTDKKQH